MSLRLGFAVSLTTALASLALVITPARADVLLQTATLGATGQVGSGFNIATSQYLGARFQTSQAFTLTTVQIHSALLNTSGNSLVFAAIVPIANLDAFPSDPLIANDNPVEVHTFSPPSSSDVVTIPFSASLPAGSYALVFGSGEFGATGFGLAAFDNTDIGTPSYFFTNGGNFINGGSSMYFVVNGSAGVAAAPEPGSLALLALAGLPLAGLLRCKRI